MKKLLALIVTIFAAFQIYAQDSQAVSTKMNDARFEVIQNPNVRKYTFCLDKINGDVYLLVETKNGNNTWQLMDVYPKDKDRYTEPTYQIFISGLVSADTFLINTKTGRIWLLVQGPNDTISWEEMQ